MPYDDFPSIPRLEEVKSIKINSNDLMLGFKSVWYSVSNSNINQSFLVFIYTKVIII